MIRKIAAVSLALIALTACAPQKSEEQKQKETPAVVETLSTQQVTALITAGAKQPKLVALDAANFKPKATASNAAGQWVYYCNLCALETPDWERQRVLMYLQNGIVIDSAFVLELPAPEDANKGDVLRCVTAKPLDAALIAEFGEISKTIKMQAKVIEVRQGSKGLKVNTFNSAAGNAWDCHLKDRLVAP